MYMYVYVYACIGMYISFFRRDLDPWWELEIKRFLQYSRPCQGLQIRAYSAQPTGPVSKRGVVVLHHGLKNKKDTATPDPHYKWVDPVPIISGAIVLQVG